MNQVASVPLNVDLLPFSQWLLLQGIAHRIVEEGGEQVILIENNQYAQPMAQNLQRYINEPEFQGEMRRQVSEQLRQLADKKKHPQAAQISYYPRASPKQAPVIFSLILISVVIAFMSDFGRGGPLLRALLILDPFKIAMDLSTVAGRWQGLIEMLALGELWRVVSPDVIHFNVMHITFNVLMLWVLGGQLEIQKGSVSFVALTVFVSIISNIAQLLEGGYLFGGLSGVVYGLVGYCWLWKFFQPKIFFPSVLMKFSLVWLLLGYTPITEWLGWGRMANAAHLYGLLAGLLWGGVTLFVNEVLLKKRST